MADSPTFQTFRIDKTAANFPTLVNQYRSLRLEALTTSKTSFASTYEEESVWPICSWVTRLARPGVEHFIIATNPTSATDKSEQKWLGQLVLLGPLSLQDYALAPEANEPESQITDAEKETRWQLTALYISPEYRRQRLGKLLCKAAIEYANDVSAGRISVQNISVRNFAGDVDGNGNSTVNGVGNGGKKARVRLFIHPDNSKLISFYEDLGFVNAGRCTREEAMIMHGDEGLLPPVEERKKDPERYYARVGLVMASGF
jgi:ribosomal protein S18 acetylase RimI-like enzyme